jgi:hypothetical protein
MAEDKKMPPPPDRPADRAGQPDDVNQHIPEHVMAKALDDADAVQGQDLGDEQ